MHACAYFIVPSCYPHDFDKNIKKSLVLNDDSVGLPVSALFAIKTCKKEIVSAPNFLIMFIDGFILKVIIAYYSYVILKDNFVNKYINNLKILSIISLVIFAPCLLSYEFADFLNALALNFVTVEKVIKRAQE